MKQSCPSLALVELLLTTHLLETSAASATLVDFIDFSALIVFMVLVSQRWQKGTLASGVGG